MMLPLRNSISPPRETSIPSIKSTLMPPNHSKLTSVMIAQEYDDHRIFGYLGSTVHDANGWEISLALSRWKRDTLVLERVYVGIVVLLMRCSDPSLQLALYGDCRTSEARRRCNYKHKRDHDTLSSVSVGAADSCCCRRNEK